MRKKLAFLLGSFLILSALLIQMGIPCVRGDIYVVTTEIEGITFHNGTDIFMPNADVSINITRTESHRVDVSFSGQYMINTTSNQNATLAFVYPDPWNLADDEPSQNYSISINGSVIDYTVYEWEELGFEYPSDIVEMTGTWVEHANYATFTATFLANTTCIIHVTHHESFSYIGNEFLYSYIVESARSFGGTTHQKVHMILVEADPFLEKEFSPDISLTQWQDNNTTHAIWDFIVQESSIEEVQIRAVAATYHGDIRPDTNENGIDDTYEPPLIALGIVAIVVVLGIIFYKRYH